MTEKRRFALIVANNEYQDVGLKKLIAPAQDAKELAQVLKDPSIGGFEVKIILNQPSYDVSKEIESFFTSDHDRDDLLLLYFSCHGIKDDYGNLYFATVNTFRNIILATSVPADFVNRVMERSRSRKQVLLLDCCYSGAFARGTRATKDDKKVHIKERFEGRGRVVMTASDSTQYSFEGDEVKGENVRSSVFTNALVQGLSTGAADLDENGHIDYAELYNYVYNIVKGKTPQQSPRVWAFDLEGEKIIIGHNPKLNSPPECTAMISEALEYYANEDYTTALSYLDKALAIDPKSAKAFYFKGNTFVKLNKYKEAIDCYENALKIDAKYEPALTNLLLTVRTYVNYKERGAEQRAEFIKDDIQKDIDATSTISLDANTPDPGLEKVTVVSNYSFITNWGGYNDKMDRDFHSPEGVAIDSSGNVYVADTFHHCIQKFDSNGKFITKWGSEGWWDGQFKYPDGIAVDSSGNVYVADRTNGRIQKFDGNGKFITKWGSRGMGDGQFKYPDGIAVDSSGNVYVADGTNGRIQKFDSNGKFITKWGSEGTGDGQFRFPSGIAVDSSENVYVVDTNNHRIQKFDSNGKFITKWGSIGKADGQFNSPEGVAIDSSGNVYVVDTFNDCIQKFDSNGKFITKWGSEGMGDGQFDNPADVAVDSSGNVYVADTGNHRITKYNTISLVNTKRDPGLEEITASDYTFVKKWGSIGKADGQFYKPWDVAVDSSGNVYVVDTNNHRIQKFDSNGNFITTWHSTGKSNRELYYPEGIAVDSSGYVYVVDTGNNCIQKYNSNGIFITKWGSEGRKDRQFLHPSGIAVDSSRNVYVVDTGNDRIQRFDSNGKFITKWGSKGFADVEFYHPSGIAVDSSGNVYVVDTGNHNSYIQKFGSWGRFITKWGSEGTGDGQFRFPSGIAVDSSENVYVVDHYNNCIQKFDSNGKFITKWGSEGSGDRQFDNPAGIAVDSSGNVYVVDSSNHRITKYRKND